MARNLKGARSKSPKSVKPSPASLPGLPGPSITGTPFDLWRVPWKTACTGQTITGATRRWPPDRYWRLMAGGW